MQRTFEYIKKQRVDLWCLRFGLAFVFAYAAISSFQAPLEWVGYLPSFLTRQFNGTLLIELFAAYELLLAIWLLSTKYTAYAALLSTATLAGIVITNGGQMIITFRDVGLVFMSLALYFMSASTQPKT